jgi:glucose/arabinose dehydrogenase
MRKKFDDKIRLRAYNQRDQVYRNANPVDINLPPGYGIEVFAVGLETPIDMAFSENGDLYIADAGITSGRPKILRLRNGQFEVVADNFNVPITGISLLDGNIYVSHRGYITLLHSNGTRQDIISGLPCNGDYSVSNVAFGPEGKIYFGLGTATNSGVVGPDNNWVYEHPLLHDEPASEIMVNGQNFSTKNMLAIYEEDAYTGCFSSYGVANNQNEIKKGVLKASGSILRANRNGTQLELVAWGFRNPIRLKFDQDFRLFVSNRSYDVRGSRPVANAPDEFHEVMFGVWYGWPDYSVGEPLTSPRFKPDGGHQPEFLLTYHPNIPPKPFAEFPSHSSIMGFDINYNRFFGPYGDIYIAEYGSLGPATMGPSTPYEGIGHRISRIDMNTRIVSTFVNNKTGLPALTPQDTGLGRLVDVAFGPDGAMYILDIGISDPYDVNRYIANTGVIWRVTRSVE